MSTPPWYQTLFENYAHHYDQESFTQGTIQEVDFIEQVIHGNKNLNILDIGCGTGRHAIELARRGYAVTGIDLSSAQLRRAKEKAQEAKVTVSFIEADARQLTYAAEFNVALIICEGAFSLMETDEMNYQILAGARRALKPPGTLILTALNALFPLQQNVDDFLNAQLNTGQSSHSQFDPLTLRMTSQLTFTDDAGCQKTLLCNERYFMPSEITGWLKTLGFHTIDIMGCQVGQFNRQQPLTAKDYEMLVIANC